MFKSVQYFHAAACVLQITVFKDTISLKRPRAIPSQMSLSVLNLNKSWLVITFGRPSICFDCSLQYVGIWAWLFILQHLRLTNNARLAHPSTRATEGPSNHAAIIFCPDRTLCFFELSRRFLLSPLNTSAWRKSYYHLERNGRRIMHDKQSTQRGARL